MKVNNIEIKGVAGIKKISINFNEGLNILCGANGIGKTTILDCIATAFMHGVIKLKKNSQCEKGTVNIIHQLGDIIEKNSYEINDFDPQSDNSHYYLKNRRLGEKILYFKPHRDIPYNSLDSIGKDPNQQQRDYYFASIVTEGVKAKDIKNWLIHRYLFFDKEDSISEKQKDNYKTAIQCFTMMDSDVRFKTVIASSYEIMLETNKGDIYFEYLSAGYKSAVYILIGLIKELEYRITNPYISVEDFEGIILIDEIDVHLHPHWQSKLVLVLKKLLPKAQIIATTHSPSILQVLEKDELIALEEDSINSVRVKELNLGKYGLKGWTVEEILTDVMGLPSTSSKEFKEAMDMFDQALEKEDTQQIKNAYAVLNEMLHPESNLRRLLKIQMAGLED